MFVMSESAFRALLLCPVFCVLILEVGVFLGVDVFFGFVVAIVDLVFVVLE
jgi:hypothetical protein